MLQAVPAEARSISYVSACNTAHRSRFCVTYRSDSVSEHRFMDIVTTTHCSQLLFLREHTMEADAAWTTALIHHMECGKSTVGYAQELDGLRFQQLIGVLLCWYWCGTIGLDGLML